MQKYILCGFMLLFACTAVASAAPPDDSTAQQNWMTYHNPYAQNKDDISTAHRTGEEVLIWAQKAVTSALSLSPETLDTQIMSAKNFFAPSGWSEYANYVRSTKLLEIVRDKKYTVSTIVDGDAVILNSGSVDGAYRWLVRAPLMITFLHTDPATGKQTATDTGKFTLTFQIGRTAANTRSTEGMAIESWDMTTGTQ